MGLAKQAQIEAEERGWWSIEGYVCGECVGEKFLTSFVEENASQPRCDYCGRKSSQPIAADADQVMDLIGAGLHAEWSHAVQVLSRDDGEWIGEVYDTQDVLWESGLFGGETFLSTVAEAFVDDAWCDAAPYSLQPHEVLAYGWERFADHVTHHTRYVFLIEPDDRSYPDDEDIHPGQMLNRLGHVIQEAGIIRRLPRGTRFFRARDHEEVEMPRHARDLGSPPQDLATQSNRMSPAGIPMFYGASDPDTAIAELGHSMKPMATYGEFVTLQELRVVDLSKLPEVPSLR